MVIAYRPKNSRAIQTEIGNVLSMIISGIKHLNKKLKTLSPIQQALAAVVCLLIIQYTGNIIAYYEILPIVFGKDPNGIIKNTTYIVPGILSVVLSLYFGGSKGLMRVFIPYTVWRVKLGYWVLVIFIMLLLNYIGLIVSDIVLMREIQLRNIIWVDWNFIREWTPLFASVGISDELFWIGFVLPRLVGGGLTPYKASLVLGCFWGLDYIPYIFTGFFIAEGVNISTQLLASAALAPWYAWLYYRTGSALILLVFAVFVQYSIQLLPLLPHNNDGSNVETLSAIFAWFVSGMLLWKLMPISKNSAESSEF